MDGKFLPANFRCGEHLARQRGVPFIKVERMGMGGKSGKWEGIQRERIKRIQSVPLAYSITEFFSSLNPPPLPQKEKKEGGKKILLTFYITKLTGLCWNFF